MRIISHNFFTVDAVELAQKLLNKILVRNINGKIIKVRIVETEAYNGKIDQACHAHPANKSNWKAQTLYNRGGYTYVYLIYGIYYCFNIVSSLEKDPQGVLIRAVEPLDSHTIPVIFPNRKNQKIHYYTNGPGKLCRALNIDDNLNNVDLTTSNLIYLEDRSTVNQKEFVATKRINIDYAGKDKDRLWRFYIKNNLFISKK